MKVTYEHIKHLTVVFCIFLGISCTSDDPNGAAGFQNQVDFIRTLGGSGNEAANAIISTGDGGFAILGYAQSMDGDLANKPNDSYDYWLLKYNSQSELEWSKTYGGTGDDRGSDIIQTTDGGYAMIGTSSSSDLDVSENAGTQDHWLARLDPSGNIIWQKSFGFIGSDSGFSIIQSSDGGFLISGVLDVSASGGAGNTRHAGGDYWALKLDSQGNLQWSKYFGGTFTDTPFDVIETSNGYMMVGSTDSNDVDIADNNGQYDFWVVNISLTGDLNWAQTYGGTGIDEARSIAATNDGNFLIVGDTRSNDIDIDQNSGGADLWVIKIDPSGDLLWEKTIGGSSFDVGRSVSRTTDNGFLISGSSRSSDGDTTSNQGQNDAWILKIDSNADLLWQRSIGGSNIDFANDATELNDRTVIAVGETNSDNGDISMNQGFNDLLIIKLQ